MLCRFSSYSSIAKYLLGYYDAFKTLHAQRKQNIPRCGPVAKFSLLGQITLMPTSTVTTLITLMS